MRRRPTSIQETKSYHFVLTICFANFIIHMSHNIKADEKQEENQLIFIKSCHYFFSQSQFISHTASFVNVKLATHIFFTSKCLFGKIYTVQSPCGVDVCCDRQREMTKQERNLVSRTPSQCTPQPQQCVLQLNVNFCISVIYIWVTFLLLLFVFDHKNIIFMKVYHLAF